MPEQSSPANDVTPHGGIEPPQPPPGGADAVVSSDYTTDPVAPDVDPERNPSTEDVPDEAKEGEDTSTQATRGEDADSEEESPA